MSEPFLIWSSNLKPEQAEALIAWGKAIRQAEQERILKLIDKWRKDTNWTRTHFEYSKALSEVESLIKGEQIIA
jgi:hypothetical protein